VRDYALKVGRSKSMVQVEVSAARVALSTQVDKTKLVSCAKHLAEIHAAPQHCWTALVARMIENDWTVEEAKSAVRAISKTKPPQGFETYFQRERIEHLVARGEDAADMMQRSVRTIERARSDMNEAQHDSDTYVTELEQWLGEHGAWDVKAVSAKAQEILEAQREARREAEARVAKLNRPITLPEWDDISSGDRQAILGIRSRKAKLNKQDPDSAIDWARWSWNPVTGCQHGCRYCYARDIAERFFAQKFVPSLIPEVLAAPLNCAPPKEAATDVGYKNIFTCSMADLFGKWVPKEWIEAVLDVACKAPQWNFLMLTKNPQRLSEFDFPDNVWLGTTVDCQARVVAAEQAMALGKAAVKWVSIEPMLEPIEMDFRLFNWVVIGGASRSNRTPEWKPPRRWVRKLTDRAIDAGCAVYWKSNLNLDPVRQFPGSISPPDPEAAPEQFRCPHI
jgi:protein gp37